MNERQGEDFRAAMPLMTFQGSGIEDSDFMHSDDDEDPLESVLNRMKYRPQASQPHDLWPSVLLAGSLCLVAGFVLSYVAFVMGQKSLLPQELIVKDTNVAMGTLLGQLASEQRILDFMSELRQEGPEGEVNRLHQHFLGEGFDNAYIFNHTLRSYAPNPQHTNKVSLINESTGKEHITASVNVSTTFPISGTITGRLVYVNQGLAEDWLQLEGANVSVEGQIVVARTGPLWPEDLAESAFQKGASALLLFPSDQQDFPFWFPHSVSPGVGGLYQESQGFRLPVATLEAKDAENILTVSMVDVDSEGEGWSRERTGQAKRGFLRLQAQTVPHVTPLFNVVAVQGGREEPDRYVVIGAHRTDTRNGTAALMELARIFGKLKTSTSGWRPRRTLVLASWGGEGAVGAATWVSQFQLPLRGRAVAYIDIHQLSQQEGFSNLVQGSPLVRQALSQVAPLLPGPSPLRPDPEAPLQLPGWRGGCQPFLHGSGTPCLGLLYTNLSTLVAATRLGGVAGWLLADSSLLPFDVRHEPAALQHCLARLHEQHDAMLTQHDLSLQVLDRAVAALAEAALRFRQHVNRTTIHTGVQLREVNDQVRQLSSTLLLPQDSQTRDQFSWPSSTAVAGLGFGPLQDLLASCASPSHLAEHKQRLQQHVETLARAVEAAATLLLPPSQLQ